jgi:hypothetical protein
LVSTDLRPADAKLGAAPVRYWIQIGIQITLLVYQPKASDLGNFFLTM